MQLLRCEVCGSNEMTKKDGLFVCDYCGAKYTLEETRKMVMDGEVRVSGSISLDNTAKIRGLMQSAVDDYDDSKLDSALETVNQILLIDPYIPDALYLKALLTDKKDMYSIQRSLERASENQNKSLGILDKELYDYYSSLVWIRFKCLVRTIPITIQFDDETLCENISSNKISV